MAAPETFRRLDGREIVARLSGREITDGTHWAYRLDRTGKLITFALGKSGSGTWRVQGRELCLDRAITGQRCFEVWVSGSRLELRREPGPPEEAFVLAPGPGRRSR